eukprot:CCRYP_014471-RC/>CCRYP_014471-RC protein AED:0.38 eAED:0.38 QI:0/-1/0/1/-1/0/1/0/119
MIPKPSPMHSRLSSITTSSNSGTPIVDRYRARAWVSPRHHPGQHYITPSMKTGCYPVGIQTSCSTAASSMISLESGHAISAPNATTLSGPSSNRICNNGAAWNRNSPPCHGHATTWTLH